MVTPTASFFMPLASTSTCLMRQEGEWGTGWGGNEVDGQGSRPEVQLRRSITALEQQRLQQQQQRLQQHSSRCSSSGSSGCVVERHAGAHQHTRPAQDLGPHLHALRALEPLVTVLAAGWLVRDGGCDRSCTECVG